jgi:hypothetical protein
MYLPKNDKGLIKRPELGTNVNCRLYIGPAVLGGPLYSLECLMLSQSRLHFNYKAFCLIFNTIAIYEGLTYLNLGRVLSGAMVTKFALPLIDPVRTITGRLFFTISGCLNPWEKSQNKI